ncbi:unnamed protein product [Amaranthus hypochondriacus]
MPSFWKKQKKGNRISRFVADLQTPSKHGGSLVVETGFPTSLIDLFHKNRDKLKKPKSKKSKSKTLITISEDEIDDHRPPSISLVSYPHASNELDVGRYRNFEEINVSHNDENHDNFVGEIVHENHDDVESCRIEKNDPCKNENHVSFLNEDHGSCEIVNDEEKIEVGKDLGLNYMGLLLISIGVLGFFVALYLKRWFLASITLGFVVLVSLECVGRWGLGLFKGCECDNVVWRTILKGALVVIVAFYTKWFVVGITIGASLLLLLEYVGNSIFGFLKPCQDARSKFRGVLPHWGGSKQGEEIRAKRDRMGFDSSKREVPNELSDDHDLGGENGTMLSREIDPKCENDLNSKRGFEGTFDEDGIVNFSKAKIEQGSKARSLANLLKEEKQNKLIHELLALESSSSKPLRSLDFRDSIRSRSIDLKEEVIEGCKIVGVNSKIKKNNKFWKKLLSKKNGKEKHKTGSEHCANVLDNVDVELEISNQDRLTRSISEPILTLTPSSFSNEENDGGIDKFEAANACITEMLQLENKTIGSSRIVEERIRNSKCLTAFVIPLTGLIGGRMLAVVVTVICCLVFKIVRT